MKKGNAKSGKSRSSVLPFGERRKIGGKELAPRSIRRRKGVSFLSECSKEDLVKARVMEEE